MIIKARSEALRNACGIAGYDALIVFGNAWQGDYLRYASGFGIVEGEGLALVRPDRPVSLFLDQPFEFERAQVECPGIDVTLVTDLLEGGIAELEGAATIGVAPMSLAPHHLWRRRAGKDPVDATPLFDRLLMAKLPEELALIRTCARLADEGYEVFRHAARIGRADYEVVAEVEAFFRAKGADDNFMLIGSGGTEVRGMAPPSGRILKSGDLVTTELTPAIDGYYVQICRTLVMGEPSGIQRTAFGIFSEALERGIAAVRPGSTASDVAIAQNEVFRGRGLGDFVTTQYTRVRGHGLGLFTDSKPPIVESSMTTIEPNMALIVHPNTYHPDVGYIVLGDALIVGTPGNEILTKTARELFANQGSGG